MLLNLGRHHQNDYQRRHPRTSEDKSKSLRAGFKSFEKLVTMIEDGDVEGAVAHWRLHLRNANETWATRGEGERTVDSLHRSEEHTSELQSLMRISYAVFCLKKKKSRCNHERHLVRE